MGKHGFKMSKEDFSYLNWQKQYGPWDGLISLRKQDESCGFHIIQTAKIGIQPSFGLGFEWTGAGD